MRLLDRLHPQHPAVQVEDAPLAHEVLLEIGLVLAVHLALALAVALTLGTLGVA